MAFIISSKVINRNQRAIEMNNTDLPGGRAMGGPCGRGHDYHKWRETKTSCPKFPKDPVVSIYKHLFYTSPASWISTHRN